MTVLFLLCMAVIVGLAWLAGNSAANWSQKRPNEAGDAIKPLPLSTPSRSFDGPAELPRSAVSTALPGNYASMPIKSVCASGCNYSNLQTAINTETCGTRLQLKAAEVHKGVFTISKACTASSWFILESSAMPHLPVGGTESVTVVSSPLVKGDPTSSRIVPASHAAYMPIISSNTINAPGLRIGTGAAYIRIQGIAFTGSVDGTNYFALHMGWVNDDYKQDTYAESPDHIIADRIFVYGRTSTASYSRGIGMDCQNCALINSFMEKIQHGGSSDAQNVAIMNGQGPFLIDNNTLGGCPDENIGIGIAVPRQQGLVPRDIVITRNYIKKDTPCSYGQQKNAIEIKSGSRGLVEANYFENIVNNETQKADMLLLSPRCLRGSGPCRAAQWQAETNDWTLRYNAGRRMGALFRVSGLDYTDGLDPHPIRQHRASIHDNLVQDLGKDIGADPYHYMLLTKPDTISIHHNSTFMGGSGYGGGNTGLYLDLNSGTTTGYPMTGSLVFKDNVLGASPEIGGFYGVFASCCRLSTPTQFLDAWAPGIYTFDHNVFIDTYYAAETHPATNQSCGGSCFPKRSAFQKALVDPSNCSAGRQSLTACAISPRSKYKNAGSDGKDVGADVAAIVEKTRGVKQ